MYEDESFDGKIKPCALLQDAVSKLTTSGSYK